MKLSNANKRFLILDSLNADQEASQRDISAETGISLGQTNVIIKKLCDEGHLIQEVISRKRVRYPLTEKGRLELSRYSNERVVFILREYRSIKKAVSELLAKLYERGFREFVLEKELGDLHEVVRDAFDARLSGRAAILDEPSTDGVDNGRVHLCLSERPNAMDRKMVNIFSEMAL